VEKSAVVIDVGAAAEDMGNMRDFFREVMNSKRISDFRILTFVYIRSMKLKQGPTGSRRRSKRLNSFTADNSRRLVAKMEVERSLRGRFASLTSSSIDFM
jgi:hypothetical protein